MDDDLGAARGLARAVRERLQAEGLPPPHLRVRRPHRAFCEEVATIYEHAPLRDPAAAVAEHYRRHAAENRALYELARRSGIRIRPWVGPGNPYAGSRELIDSVRRTGELRVFLTRSGHGPDGDPAAGHPLRSPSGVVEEGVELVDNDLLRAVHDLYGHVLHGTGFDLRGELAASHAHSRLHSPPARRVLFTEQVGQICWYYHGPHRRDAAAGRGRRPYPVQKVFLYPTRHLAGLTGLFEDQE